MSVSCVFDMCHNNAQRQAMKPSIYSQWYKRMRDRIWCMAPAFLKRFWLNYKDEVSDAFGI